MARLWGEMGNEARERYTFCKDYDYILFSYIYIYIIYIYTHSCYLTVKRAFFSDWLLGIRISKNHDLLDLPRIKRSQRKPEATLFQAVTQITVVKLHIG